MEETFRIAAIWLSLAVAATVLANHLRISIALVEICMGVTAGAVAVALGKADLLGFNSEWLRFLASSGAVLLTFLAGAELDPGVIRTKLKEVSVVGLIGFFAPSLDVLRSHDTCSVGMLKPACLAGSPFPPPRWPLSTR
jgi:Kef-type K+ transport system membrane component KefB